MRAPAWTAVPTRRESVGKSVDKRRTLDGSASRVFYGNSPADRDRPRWYHATLDGDAPGAIGAVCVQSAAVKGKPIA